MKDLFSGSLGRLNNRGGSRMFTTPNTINVPPEYSVETDVPSVAEFVTCTLDGRLWIFRRSRRYYLAAFRWNEETQRLVFVSTTILSNETVIKSGVDWILTDKSFIQPSDSEPYIIRTEYSNDDTTYIDMIRGSFSFFPEFETWEEIQNEKLNVDGSPSNKWKIISQNAFTPMEFHYYNDNDIQTVTDFKPQLCYCNGQLYAKGKAHIGRAYLLPCGFDAIGNPYNFYLYISPDYLRSYDTENQTFNDNDGWDKLILAPLNQNSVCIFTPENEDYVFCKKPENNQVLSLPQCEQLDFTADNGSIFFDGATHSNLVINDNGALFLYDNLSYKCKGLSQWLAPSDIVSSISKQLLISSCDNSTFVTHTQQGFYRELLTEKTLPISINTFSSEKFSVNVFNKNSVKNIEVNSIITATSLSQSANWKDIYLNAFKLYRVGYQEVGYDNGVSFSDSWVSPYPMYIISRSSGAADIWRRVYIYYYDKNGGFYSPLKLTSIEIPQSEIKRNSYITSYFVEGETIKAVIKSPESSSVITLCNVPSEILNWQDTEQDISIIIDTPYDPNRPNSRLVSDVVLRESHTNMQFRTNLGFHAHRDFFIRVYHDTTSLFEDNIYTRTICVIQARTSASFSDNPYVAIVYLELYPEIFDFKSEIERSKLS